MKRSFALTTGCITAFLTLAFLCQAAMFSAGKHTGVVIFDRWGGCSLVSGISVVYVSEQIKNQLRAQAGQAVQIDVTKAHQLINPGPARIDGFKSVDAVAPDSWGELKHIRLSSLIRAGADGKPIATMVVENAGKDPVTLSSNHLSLIILTKRDLPGRGSSSDGPSVAVARTELFFSSSGGTPRWEGRGVDEGVSYAWSIGRENAPPRTFTLGATQRQQIDVQLELADGEYEFLCSYRTETNAGQCLASNLSAFDVKDVRAIAVQIKDRTAVPATAPVGGQR